MRRRLLNVGLMVIALSSLVGLLAGLPDTVTAEPIASELSSTNVIVSAGAGEDTAASYRFNPNATAQENEIARLKLLERIELLSRMRSQLEQSQSGLNPTLIDQLKISQIDPAQASISPQLLDRLNEQIQVLRAETSYLELFQLCNPTASYHDVEKYYGEYGLTRDFVMSHQVSTGLLKWHDNLSSILSDPQIDAGDVSGTALCSGTLIGQDLFLTAGHCFAADLASRKSKVFPRRQSGNTLTFLTPKELAPLMVVKFNFQLNGKTGVPRESDDYSVLELIEYEFNESLDDSPLDFAILKLGRGRNGETPGVNYPPAAMEVSLSALSSSKELMVIQHPLGMLKQVAFGKKMNVRSTNLIFYDLLDTLEGSSGAGILNQDGKLIGIHTSGGCSRASYGSNWGVSLSGISKLSKIVK